MKQKDFRGRDRHASDLASRLSALYSLQGRKPETLNYSLLPEPLTAPVLQE